ncbi:HlyD family type I secretion periplasmic adaptor subunit [Methylobacillus gramineus]|uniref:HlyD family type I secretion periplasmic adaptor subunit n=1 Tax=Methylobacillus gramineus TaxID=755169 RepID=UPI001CFF6994|nr:HlyD family type I secretion periplasmic adaptor subunit [Methylobacillus gramineus]MCB5184519.1 HlyD family type I secretion periplasmic adaptor subunit [Methylobacillus gramineus]
MLPSFKQAKASAERPVSQQALDFAPGLLQIQEQLPSPLPRMVLRGLLLLLLALIVWAMFGRLDVVAVAEGKLIPSTYLKIVQPAEAGIVREISVRDGQHVQAGQVLVRMDANISEADSKSIQQAREYKVLELRRVEAEIHNRPLERQSKDSPELFSRILSEYHSNRLALDDSIQTEKAALQKSKYDLAATLELQRKLEETLPSYKVQEAAYEKLGKVGFVGSLMVLDKQRERIEKEQDFHAQQYNAESLRANILQSERRISQIISDYKRKLEAERVSTYAEVQRLDQEWAKQAHRNSLLELRAPQSGIIKDLATHTPGTVVSPGTVLMTLVPNDEQLLAEVWVKNTDAGFVRTGQEVQLKLMAYPFQKYGMVTGEVLQLSADSTDRSSGNNNQQTGAEASQPASAQFSYRALLKLQSQHLVFDRDHLTLAPGMQVAAEIKLIDQTIMEYVLSPVRKAFHEAARER